MRYNKKTEDIFTFLHTANNNGSFQFFYQCKDSFAQNQIFHKFQDARQPPLPNPPQPPHAIAPLRALLLPLLPSFNPLSLTSIYASHPCTPFHRFLSQASCPSFISLLVTSPNSTRLRVMASHDQSYQAGETKGQTTEKAGQVMESAKDKAYETAEAAKEKASETAQAAKDRAHEDKEKTGGFLKEKTEAAKEKALETAQSAKNTAVAVKEKTTGILQQTGEKVKDITQGAQEAVKHTLGMGGADDDTSKTSAADEK